jgi:hypothetical protein
MRRLLTLSWLGITVGGIALLNGCVSGHVSERPTDATFCLLDSCGAFHDQYRRYPNDYAELSTFVQQSGKWKFGHYEQVQFAHLPDGRLAVWDVCGGVTNSGILTPAPPKKKQ